MSTWAAALRPFRHEPRPGQARFRLTTRPPEKHPHLLQNAYMPTSMTACPKLSHEVSHLPRSGVADDAKQRVHRHQPPCYILLWMCSSGFHENNPEAASLDACARVNNSGRE